MKGRSAIWILGVAAVAFIATTALAAARPARQKHGPETARGCRYALPILEALTPDLYEHGFDNFVVRDAPKAGKNESNAVVGWQGASPSRTFVRSWFEQSPGSITECIAGNEFKGRPILSVEAEKSRRAQARSVSSDMFIRISKPVLDRDGRHALVFYLSEGASGGGHGQFYYLERKGARWEVTGRRVLWVS